MSDALFPTPSDWSEREAPQPAVTNPMTETVEKGMTHEAGIEAACNKAGSYGVHRPSVQCMADAIQAYLSASGMVLVPREPTKEMIKAGDDAGAKAWRTGEHMATAIIRAGISSASESFESRALA